MTRSRVLASPREALRGSVSHDIHVVNSTVIKLHVAVALLALQREFWHCYILAFLLSHSPSAVVRVLFPTCSDAGGGRMIHQKQ